ncbi:hypothetical protein O181_007894 [Austropuccinia psidii MF-1]|uniref:Reverse transcriptase Ty1/copia-type domain-containing protein n=1 Tax=Austropuccinia psidii MF-1 TaxID=1389203 RepID=A0A9Q3BLR3_9BASI|nr:hypothetical protein [Austropuccinia psidii MF-1]
MLLYVHVNDLIVGGSWNEEFKMKIKSYFDMEELGKVKYALGIQISQKDDYISNIKSFRTIPSKEIDPPFNYQRAIGLLQYLVQCTRPDLAFATSFLSQYLESPKDLHYNAVKHVLTYLNSTKHYELRLSQNILQQTDNSILAFTDSDWGGSEGYKSFSAAIIYYYGIIGWRSHKQKVVSLSSAEAEYNAMSEGTQDLQWTANLIFEITKERKQQILFTNNQSAISIASNHIYHHGTRHVNFRLHFIKKLIEEEKLKIEYLDTNKMIADSLTKNNPYSKSINHFKIIFGNQDLSSSSCLLSPHPTTWLRPTCLALSRPFLTLCDKSIMITKDGTSFHLSQNNTTIISGHLIEKLMIFALDKPLSNLTESDRSVTWHQC